MSNMSLFWGINEQTNKMNLLGLKDRIVGT